jgi:glycosyltransferase involved in cell wall biosynthesis
MGFTEPNSLMKLMAIIEAGSVTGPAKNLLAFCQSARNHSFIDLPLIETSVTTFRRPSENQPPNIFVEKALDLGISVDVVEERFRFDIRVVDDLKKLVAREKPDVIQTHNVKSHFLIRLSGLWKEIPWIAFHHGYTTTDLKMRAYNQLDRWSLRKAHRVVTMNQLFANQLERVGAKPKALRILHNAVDVENILNVASKEAANLKNGLRIDEGESVVMAIGRLSFEKGHIDLIRAFAQLMHSQRSLQTKLVIVGEGPEREKLEREIAQLTIKDRVIFAGQVKDVRPIYAIADVMVLPSHSEGSPNVLLEAMAAKVPTVATKVGGVPEIATHNENALLVEARDTKAMAEAMALLLSNKDFAQILAANAQEHVSTKHSPEARLRSLLEIYREFATERVLSKAQIA